MANIDYNKFYALQDEVLDVIFRAEKIFYLTGGTCLNRFYREERYSDDLDFFTHQNDDFNRVLREINVLLNDKFDLKKEISSKDFCRFKVNNLLQLDFVNDRVMRYKKLIYLKNGYIIDNYENILANKLTAVIGRDNPKDIFDIFLISQFYDFDWEDILKIAHLKAGFYNDDLIIRLKTFPVFLLKKIVLINSSFLDDFEMKYSEIIEEIERITNK